MTTSSNLESLVGEQPTSSAELTISVGPTQLGGSAKGTVPPDQAHYLITTFGILGCAITGCAAATITLRIGPAHAAPAIALAELAFALMAAILVALCGRTPVRRKSNRRKIPQGQPRPPSQQPGPR